RHDVPGGPKLLDAHRYDAQNSPTSFGAVRPTENGVEGNWPVQLPAPGDDPAPSHDSPFTRWPLREDRSNDRVVQVRARTGDQHDRMRGNSPGPRRCRSWNYAD